MRELRFFTARLLTNFFAVLAVIQFVPDGIVFPPPESDRFWPTVTGFAVVLAAVNSYVRPVVELIATPVSCVLGMLTMGLSHAAVNAAVFWAAAQLVEDIAIVQIPAAILGATIVSVVGVLGSLFLGGRGG